MSVKYISLYILECVSNAKTATHIPTYKNLCILQSHNTIWKHLGSHNALKYRKLLDLFSQRAWRWPNKGRNTSPWQYTIFIVYKTKWCVIDWHVVFICYNKPGWETLNFSLLLTQYCAGDKIEKNEMGWACGAYGWGEGAYRVLVGKPEGKRPLGRPRRRWVDKIRMDRQEVGCGYVDWIGLAQDRDRWRTLVSAVMNLRVP